MVKKIYDGTDAIMGRLGSVVAKELLKGNSVEVVNAEKVLVSGDKKLFVEKIRRKIRMGSGASMKGPKYVREEGKLLKRLIRGMLPWDRTKGREAYKRLKCLAGEEGKSEGEVIQLNHHKPFKVATLKEISRLLR